MVGQQQEQNGVTLTPKTIQEEMQLSEQKKKEEEKQKKKEARKKEREELARKMKAKQDGLEQKRRLVGTR